MYDNNRVKREKNGKKYRLPYYAHNKAVLSGAPHSRKTHHTHTDTQRHSDRDDFNQHKRNLFSCSSTAIYLRMCVSVRMNLNITAPLIKY